MLHGVTPTLQGTPSQGESHLKTTLTHLSDAIMMPIGFMIVFVYVTVMLGRLNCVQQRSMLALAGLASIGMTVGFTYGTGIDKSLDLQKIAKRNHNSLELIPCPYKSHICFWSRLDEDISESVFSSETH